VKAQVLRQSFSINNNPLEMMDVDMPIAGRGQVRIRVMACGVCRTDLHIAEGDLNSTKYPIIPGHQIIGIIDEVGPGIKNRIIGQRVGVSWIYYTCGECQLCQYGMENLCVNGQFTGYTVDGGYSQFIVVSENFVYSIPDSFNDLEAAPLLCAGVIGYRSLKLSGVKKGQTMGIYGFGSSAHIVIQIAKYLGYEVHVFTRSNKHQILARSLGAVWVGLAEDGISDSLDGSIIFAPNGDLIPRALTHLRRGGTVALAGIYMSPLPSFKYELIYGEKTLRSVANSTREDIQNLLYYANKIPIHTEVTVYHLSQANEALQDLKAGIVNGSAVLKIG